MEVSVEDVYRPGSVLDIPHRPPWSYSMTKQQLDQQEESAFQDYLSRIHSNHHPHELSLFEHNLEVHVPRFHTEFGGEKFVGHCHSIMHEFDTKL